MRATNPRIDAFLSIFESSVREEILNFCDWICRSEADVFILMARKAACFFRALEDLGLIVFNGIVSSDRALDMESDWLEGKKVIVLDDALVSGTTLHRVVLRLKELKAASIEVRVITVNDQWFQPEMLEDDAGNSYLAQRYNRMENGKCNDLCFRIVRALSILPMPYDIDYPSYGEVHLSNEEFNCMLALTGWSVFDVSSGFQSRHGVRALTAIPDRQTLSRFASSLSCHVLLSSFSKVRLYCRKKPKSDRGYDLTIVPMVVLDKLSTQMVDSLFSAILKASSDICPNEWETISISAKLRILLMFLAERLGRYWVKCLREALGISICLEPKIRRFPTLFPSDVSSSIEEICLSDAPVDFRLPISKDISTESSGSSPREPIDFEHGLPNSYQIESRLLKPFIEMYYEKERPCRNLVLKKGVSVFGDNAYATLTNRLREGVSFQDLANGLVEDYGSDLAHVYTSLFVDRAIDAGIIVPIIEQREGDILRSYRHGEDVIFGEKEKTLYRYMLYVFQEEMHREKNWRGIQKTITEKLIVLYTRIGLRKGFLRPYQDNFLGDPVIEDGVARILRVKGNLYGPTALVGDAESLRKNACIPYETDEKKPDYLTYDLQINGNYLKLNPNTGRYTVEAVDTSNLEANEIGETEIFARLFARACTNGARLDTRIRAIRSEELMKMACCVLPEDIVVALAAEIQVYISNYYRLGEDGGWIDVQGGSLVISAIESARTKLDAYQADEGRKLIDSVLINSPIERGLWRLYFDKELKSTNTTENRHLTDLFERERAWVNAVDLLLKGACYADSIVSLRRSGSVTSANPSKQDDLAKQYRRAVDEFNKLVKLEKAVNKHSLSQIGLEDSLKIAHSIVSLAEADKLIDMSDMFNLMRMSLGRLRGLLDDVCLRLGKYGKVADIETFSAVGCISFNSSIDANVVQGQLSATITGLIRDEGCKRGVIQQIPETLCENGKNSCRAIWFAAQGATAGKLVLRATVAAVSKLFDKLNSPVKGTVFSGLPFEYALKVPDGDNARFQTIGFFRFAAHFNNLVFSPCINASVVDLVIESDQMNNDKAYMYAKRVASSSSQYSIELLEGHRMAEKRDSKYSVVRIKIPGLVRRNEMSMEYDGQSKSCSINAETVFVVAPQIKGDKTQLTMGNQSPINNMGDFREYKTKLEKAPSTEEVERLIQDVLCTLRNDYSEEESETVTQIEEQLKKIPKNCDKGDKKRLENLLEKIDSITSIAANAIAISATLEPVINAVRLFIAG